MLRNHFEVFEVKFDDSSELARRYKKVPEDAVLVSDNVFAVADGITRELDSKTQLYPDPSPAAIAAKRFCEESVLFVKSQLDQEEVGERIIQRALDKANSAIKQCNEELGITEETVDFLQKDYAGTVGALGFIKDGYLYFGQVTDCGVLVLNHAGQRVVDLVDKMPGLVAYTAYLREKGEYEWDDKGKVLVRGKVRNHPSFPRFRGLRVDYGAFTGEDVVSEYYNIGSVRLREDFMAVFYSDGFEHYVEDEQFLGLLRKVGTDQARSKIKHFVDKRVEERGDAFGKEKTLICVRVGADGGGC